MAVLYEYNTTFNITKIYLLVYLFFFNFIITSRSHRSRAIQLKLSVTYCWTRDETGFNYTDRVWCTLRAEYFSRDHSNSVYPAYVADMICDVISKRYWIKVLVYFYNADERTDHAFVVPHMHIFIFWFRQTVTAVKIA
jgi:hypothetical protein